MYIISRLLSLKNVTRGTDTQINGNNRLQPIDTLTEAPDTYRVRSPDTYHVCAKDAGYCIIRSQTTVVLPIGSIETCMHIISLCRSITNQTNLVSKIHFERDRISFFKQHVARLPLPPLKAYVHTKSRSRVNMSCVVRMRYLSRAHE